MLPQLCFKTSCYHQVLSFIFKYQHQQRFVFVSQGEFGQCFPGDEDEEQTFAYLIIDPFKRHVTLFCHVYSVGDVPL